MTGLPSPKATERRSLVLDGNVRRAVFVLALPVLCEQFLHFCVGFYDTFLSGRISAQATAAIGLSAYVSWLAGMLYGLVGTGTTALVSRHWGAGEFVDANRIANRSLALASVIGSGMYAFIYFSAPTFPRLLNMDAGTSEIVIRYLRIDGIGHIFTSVSLVGAAALRGSGNMRAPMLILGLVSILNVVISTGLVFGVGPLPQFGLKQRLVEPIGIDGIVLGTVAARAAGGFLMLFVFARGISGLQLMLTELRIRGNAVQRILRIGIPAAIDGAVMWTGQFLFLMIIAHLDSDGRQSATFAAHIIGVRVEAISYLPAVAWGVAASTMIGQSLGVGDRQRAIHAGHEAARQCALLAVLISVIFVVAAPQIYELMHEEPAVHAVGVPAFRMLGLFQVPLAISIVYMFSLRGAGDTRYPLFFNLFAVFVIRVPCAYLFGIVLDGGLFGAWIGMCADMTVKAMLVWWRYVRGNWVATRV